MSEKVDSKPPEDFVIAATGIYFINYLESMKEARKKVDEVVKSGFDPIVHLHSLTPDQREAVITAVMMAVENSYLEYMTEVHRLKIHEIDASLRAEIRSFLATLDLAKTSEKAPETTHGGINPV